MPLKSKIKTLEQHHSRYSDAFIVGLTYFTRGFHVCFTYFTYSHIDALFLTLNK